MKSLLQEVPELAGVNQRYKRIDYDYDLVSGNVNYVHYQAGEPDAFHHQYEYDADNRITEVYTSSDADAYFWEKDARYFYYPHGPLARAELGDIKVQAIDYAYTIQGWLKGVNSNTLDSTRDIGNDGLAGNINARIPKDAYGYSLNYFRGDYTPVAGSITQFLASTSALDLSKAGPDLYNGNISSMVTTLTSIDPLNDSLLGQPIPQLTAYRYDQLNRIKQLQAYHNINVAGNAWLSSGNDNRYASSYTYDGNGNLQTVNRHDNTGATMDSTTYVYENKANGYDRETNKLRQVKDAISSSQSLEDIDNQDANNYTYDEIGQLAGDVSEGIASVSWFADHKPWKITRVDTSSMPDLEFKYDAMGNRIAEIVKPAASKSDTATWETTWYVRDAHGELLSTYTQTDSTFKTSERMLYGLSMLGVNTDAVDLLATPDTSLIGLSVGFKRYHLKNHLGNLNMVVTDKRVFTSDSVFRADVLLTNDFYPFGSLLQGGRTYYSNLTSYGFNGMRMDNEIAGTGNSYTTKFRQYDPRLGRWLSPDPAMKKYVGWSPYNFSFNNPIWQNDPKGNDPSDDNGKKRAQKAKEIDKKDTRAYGQSRSEGWKNDDYVDCSEFASEVQSATGYTTGGTKASVQAENFKKTGEFTTNLKDVKLGDQLFWKRSDGINHTGIVTEIDKDGNIYVTHATVNKHRPGSIMTNKLNSDGSIPYWNNTFVGAGRPKLSQPDVSSTEDAVVNTTDRVKGNEAPAPAASTTATPVPSTTEEVAPQTSSSFLTRIINFLGKADALEGNSSGPDGH